LGLGEILEKYKTVVIGDRFGKLIVKNKFKKLSKSNQTMYYCECDCDCGNTINTRIYSLLNGKTKSCGCLKIKDLTGQRFGKLIAIRRDKKKTSKKDCWFCQCDCGNTKIISMSQLTGGITTSCGCGNHEDLTGLKFGKLTVKQYSYKRDNEFYWICDCECGGKKTASAHGLKRGDVKSCGCIPKGSKRNKNSALNLLYQSYRDSAKRKNRSFDLSIEFFAKITKENCAYCGIEPNQKGLKRMRGEYIFNGIDRVDSSKGYTVDNVLPCCKRCNAGKTDLSTEDFLSWIKRVYIYSIGIKNEIT
jgi:hypothetical protein